MSAPADALVLDFGGVITRTIFETHRDSERVLGLEPGTLTWRGPFEPESDLLWQSMQAGEITERNYWYERAKETGARVGEVWDTLPKFLRRIRGDDPIAAIRPETLRAIATAKAARRRLAILSNELDLFYGAGFRAKLPFLEDFDLIVDASYTKILKPDLRAYAFVTDGLGLAPERCVFVDDQIKNIRGAEAAGMQTVHFDVRAPDESCARALALLGIEQKMEDGR